MIAYKIQTDESNKPISVLRSDGWSIPFDPANTDYQEFLRWCEAGNEPLPPDSQE
jgi:hypothetical protein